VSQNQGRRKKCVKDKSRLTALRALKVARDSVWQRKEEPFQPRQVKHRVPRGVVGGGGGGVWSQY